MMVPVGLGRGASRTIHRFHRETQGDIQYFQIFQDQMIGIGRTICCQILNVKRPIYHNSFSIFHGSADAEVESYCKC